MRTIGKPRGPGQGGNERAARFRELCGRVYPPYPGDVVLIPAASPRPALLPPELGVEARREFLIRAQVAARQERFPTARAFSASPKKWAKVLDAAAEALIAAEVAPALWASFSHYAWYQGFLVDRARGKFAPVQWVFSVTRIEAHAEGWYVEWKNDQPLVLSRGLPDVALQLQGRWSLMDAKVRNSSVPLETQADAFSILDEFFPDDTYERLLSTAKLAIKRMQNAIDDDVRAGGLGLV